MANIINIYLFTLYHTAAVIWKCYHPTQKFPYLYGALKPIFTHCYGVLASKFTDLVQFLTAFISILFDRSRSPFSAKKLLKKELYINCPAPKVSN